MVGFFIVEDRVQRGADDITVGLQLDAGWETAVACLKAVLETAFEGLASAASLLAVKDFMLLVCNALGALRCRGGATAGTKLCYMMVRCTATRH